MALVEDDLRGHIFRRPTERPGLLATSDLFGKTKVDLETARRLATPPKKARTDVGVAPTSYWFQTNSPV